MKLLRFYVSVFLCCLCWQVATAGNPTGGFSENKGQWNDAVLFRTKVNNGFLYIEKGEFVYQFLDEATFDKLHHKEWQGPLPQGLKEQVVRVKFPGSNTASPARPSGKLSFYENYFLGNNPSHWAGHVGVYTSFSRPNLYTGVDMEMHYFKDHLKYSFNVHPGGDPNAIKLQYEGAKSLDLTGNVIVVNGGLTEIRELPPYAYQLIGNDTVRVPCYYQLHKGQVSFSFPSGYDTSRELIIDPQIVFSSYDGSPTSNFGYTATNDPEGNAFGGCIVFGPGFPTTTGAAFESFTGGTEDVGIIKFNTDGTNLLFATYLGGSHSESPHSMICDADGNLYVYGTTGSSDFPVTSTAYQSTFGGGNFVDFSSGYGFTHAQGTDVFVAKLSGDGSQLLGCTFVGGPSNDGLNVDALLEYNYGDAFRGEIILDPQGDPVVATVTDGPGFPMAGGGFQTGFGGGTEDGVVFKLNNNLSQLMWSTYLGGSGSDAAYGIQFAPDQSLYVAGGTKSSDFPTTTGVLHPNFQGTADGFISHLSANGQNLLQSTYLGTPQYDQCFFVQLDDDGNVYTVGQTIGTYPITPGVYNNPNSGQFIHELNPTLSSTVFSTTVGRSSGEVDFSPCAFLVSHCRQIYLSGWGGAVEQFAGNANGSTTFGLPTTSDAFQQTTDGNDFYLMVLSPGAQNLQYATFFGGHISEEHVDGGTSRFDKNGTVYQAVCGGCGGNSDLPTQPGVWSQTNNSSSGEGNCNLAIFKFSLSHIHAQASIQGPSSVCINSPVQFLNQSTGASDYSWTFGDGQQSTSTAPNHMFQQSGEFTITLVAVDSADCLTSDTTQLSVVVAPPPQITVNSTTPICAGDSIQLHVTGADNYGWSPPGGLSSTLDSMPYAFPSFSQIYTVVGYNACGSDTAQIPVNVHHDTLTIDPGNIEICLGQSQIVNISGGSNLSFSPPNGISGGAGNNYTVSPDTTTAYTVSGTSPNGCAIQEQVFVHVLPGPPHVNLPDSLSICYGSSVQIPVFGADSLHWIPASGLDNSNESYPIFSPENSSNYILLSYNSCGTSSDTLPVIVHRLQVHAFADSAGCQGAPIHIGASGAISYSWEPSDLVSSPHSDSTVAHLFQSTLLHVVGSDNMGCFDSDSVFVYVYPKPGLSLGEDRIVPAGDPVNLNSAASYAVTWTPDPTLSCTLCDNPIATPEQNTTYYAETTSPQGCTARDSITLFVKGYLFIPNAFSPDGDGINDIFKPIGANITEYHLYIYNRWGQMIFHTDDLKQGWNGSENNDHYFAPQGVYLWKVIAHMRWGKPITRNGTVTLLR